MNKVSLKKKEVDSSEDFLSLQDLQPIPRILIQAFCETKEICECIEKISEDRRMVRATVKTHMRGITAASAWCSSNPAANLIIIEFKSDQEDIISFLQDLAKHCDPITKVIVIGHKNDITLYRNLIRLGVSEYLVVPISLIDIIASISRIFMNPNAAPLGRKIACIGAKGGAGSSTLAHNIGWSISSDLNSEVVIVDTDLPFGTGSISFDQDPERSIADAVLAPERVDEVYIDRLLSACTEKLSLLAAPSTLEKIYNLNPESLMHIIETAQRSVPFLILDIPHTWNEWVSKVLQSADEIVITTLPDLASLRNSKNLLDMMHKLRPNDKPPKVIINQVNVPRRPEISVEDFSKALNIKPFAVIPFEPQLFGKALNNGRMINELEEDNSVSKIISEISHVLTGRVEVKTKNTNFLNMILNTIKNWK